MGQHRRAAPRATRSSIPCRFSVVATLVAGFVSAQALLPTPQAVFSHQPERIAAAAAGSDLVAATAIPRTAVTRSGTGDAQLPSHSGTGRRIVYSVPLQRVWTVGNAGRVQHTYLVSGRLSQPVTGHYRVYSKARWTSSSVSAETMQYMVRFAHGVHTGTPIGFHSIPRDYSGHAAQSVDDLGKPLSAGCIRQRMRDAVFLWHFAHVGTRVVVIR